MSEQKNDALVEIKATVMKETAESITHLMEQTDMTMGEAIDRLALHLKPSDPDTASNIALEEMLYIFSQLDEQGFFEALRRVVLVLGACLPKELIHSLPEDIEAHKASLDQEYAAMSEEEKAQHMDAFRELINGMYEDKK